MIYYVLIVFCFWIIQKSQEIHKFSNIEGALLTTFKLMCTYTFEQIIFESINQSVQLSFKKLNTCHDQSTKGYDLKWGIYGMRMLVLQTLFPK